MSGLKEVFAAAARCYKNIRSGRTRVVDKCRYGDRRLGAAASLLTADVVMPLLPLSSAELTFRLILAFLVLVVGWTAAFMTWNK